MKNTIGRSRVLSASSSSSRSYSSSSSSSSLLQQNPRNTMEQVWKDLSIPPPPQIQNPNTSFRATTFQDFLKETTRDQQQLQQQHHHHHHEEQQLPFRAPPTALSLNSAFLGLDCNSNSPGNRSSPDQVNGGGNSVFPAAFCHDIIGSPPAVGIFSFFPNNSKRATRESSCDEDAGVDRRHKRMMKNRESAARSRARKQAYTNELEFEVNHLEAENNKLRKQLKELKLAMASQNSTKRALQRTSSASF